MSDRVRRATAALRSRNRGGVSVEGEDQQQGEGDRIEVPMGDGVIPAQSVITGATLAVLWRTPSALRDGTVPKDAIKDANAWIRKNLPYLELQKGVVVTTGRALYEYVEGHMEKRNQQ